MPCPTCSHTLACLTTDGEIRYDLCDRCGTVMATYGSRIDVYVPKLVERCRAFVGCLKDAEQSEGLEVVRVIGIIEAINTPEDRPR